MVVIRLVDQSIVKAHALVAVGRARPRVPSVSFWVERWQVCFGRPAKVVLRVPNSLFQIGARVVSSGMRLIRFSTFPIDAVAST